MISEMRVVHVYLIAQVIQKSLVFCSLQQKFDLGVEGEEEVARIILIMKQACAFGGESNGSFYSHLKVQEGSTFRTKYQKLVKEKKLSFSYKVFRRKPWLQEDPPWTDKCRIESWKT